MAWERLAHVELSGTSATIDSGTFAAKKNLRVIVNYISVQDAYPYMRFNGTTGNEYSYRRSKSTGEKTKIPTVLTFEAWHTGAATIAKLATKGDKMTVYASARNKSRDDETIVFRGNEFDFGCLNSN